MNKRRVTVGEIATKLSKVMKAEADCYEDMHAMYAPSECGYDIDIGCRRHLRRVLQQLGVTRKYALKVLKKSVSEKWLYVNGFFNLLEPPERPRRRW